MPRARLPSFRLEGDLKSIPLKNVRSLGGHPLVAYSIAAGLRSSRTTRVIVSTDDSEIAAVARAYGAEVPFLRPAELALDDTPDLPLFQHALAWLREHEAYEPDLIVQLRPTSPLRPQGLIDRAIDLLVANPRADSVRGVTVPNQNPYKMWTKAGDGFLSPLLTVEGLDEPYNAPRQSLPDVLWQTGHVEVLRRDTILRRASLTGRRVLPIVVGREYAVDIDTESDWAWAEWLLAHRHIGLVTPTAEGASARTPAAGESPASSPASAQAGS